MRNRLLAAAGAAVVLLVALFGANNVTQAQNSRETPLVQALKKVRPSVVALKVPSTSARGRPKDTTGSGVIIDERGLIVTNAHVLGSCKHVAVRLADGCELTGSVIMTDPGNALARIRLLA